MRKSIFRTTILYAVLQLSFMGCFVWRQAVSASSFFLYGGITLLMHFILIVFLIILKDDFYNISTGQPLTSINLANRITLLRISSLPTILFFLDNKDINAIKILLPVLLFFIFLTDTFDGQIARRRNELTRIGAILDSISDYSVLVTMSVVYYCNNILPRWFFILIFLRLALQAVGMLFFLIIRKPVEMKSTWGGKITIATIMITYVVELVRLYVSPMLTSAFEVVEYISACIIFILFFEKAAIFINQGRKVITERRKIPSAGKTSI